MRAVTLMMLGGVSADLLYNIGVLHVDRCEYEAATDLFGRAVGLAPTDAGLASEEDEYRAVASGLA